MLVRPNIQYVTCYTLTRLTIQYVTCYTLTRPNIQYVTCYTLTRPNVLSKFEMLHATLWMPRPNFSIKIVCLSHLNIVCVVSCLVQGNSPHSIPRPEKVYLSIFFKSYCNGCKESRKTLSLSLIILAQEVCWPPTSRPRSPERAVLTCGEHGALFSDRQTLRNHHL